MRSNLTGVNFIILKIANLVIKYYKTSIYWHWNIVLSINCRFSSTNHCKTWNCAGI